MKKIVVVVIVAIALFAVGFFAGSKAVLNSPKWVEEDGGLYLVVTDFCGNEYVDVAEKSGHMYQQFAFAVGRR